MRQHRAFLIVDEHLGRHATEPLERADQPFVGVLGVLARRAPEVKPTRIPQGIRDEVHPRRRTGDHRLQRAPVTLQLDTRRSLEPDRRPAGPQRSLRPDVVPQDRDPAPVAARLQLPQNDDAIPDAVGQQLVDLRPVRVEPARPPPRPRLRRRPAVERPLHRFRMHTHGLGDVPLVDTAVRQCLNHHEVLLRQHPSLLELSHSGGTFCAGVWGTSQIGVLRTYTIGPDTAAVGQFELAYGLVVLASHTQYNVAHQLTQVVSRKSESEKLVWVLVCWALAALHEDLIKIGSEHVEREFAGPKVLLQPNDFVPAFRT